MVDFFNIKDITLGPVSRSSGHEAYLHATYNPLNKLKSSYRVIFKKNKFGRPECSRMEVKFSQLARLFLSPGLTPEHHLVVDEHNKVLGLAIQHLCHVIEKKEGLENNYYTLDNPQTGCTVSQLKLTDPTKIPIYFLEKLPQGFYSRLAKAKALGLLTFDYESLASILSTSYTLEEDDLHKGNYGFYLVERNGTPQAVFFKIDHDLMLVDSIMSFYVRRPFHLAQGEHAFDITAKDLLSLVCLNDSSNSYWPTKFGYFSNPFDNKEYHSYADIDAFSHLGTNLQFIKAKWKSFYKQVLIPNELIEQALRECTNRSDATDRAETAAIAEAIRARLARLRAVLFSIKEFRDYVTELNQEETQALLEEILPHEPQEDLQQHVQESMAQYKRLCTSRNGFKTDDTPLHTAIKLGEYRYEETLSMFGQFINVKNKTGQTPLDAALERVNLASNEEQDPQNNVYFIMQHLLKNGAYSTSRYKRSGLQQTIQESTFKNPYLEGITAGMRYQDFRTILRDIGEDHRFGLKFKKNLALECIRRFIECNVNHPNAENRLLRLSADINGNSPPEQSEGVKYIRQLRSKLWIIRQLRGMYGLTSTQWEINKMISHAREGITIKESGCFSFFRGSLNVALMQCSVIKGSVPKILDYAIAASRLPSG